MAFGFSRRPGSGRGYVNVDNPLFAPGQRLSRRQYDRYVQQIGQRLPFAGGVAAIRDAERRLEVLRDALAERSVALDARERELAERELALAEREREGIASGSYRRMRQGAGQRRYNLALDLYVRQQREAGRVINKNQAKSEAAFRAALADIKGRPNPKGNPNIRGQNLAGRRRGFAALGGGDLFKEEYEARYGRPVSQASRGSRQHARNRGRR